MNKDKLSALPMFSRDDVLRGTGEGEDSLRGGRGSKRRRRNRLWCGKHGDKEEDNKEQTCKVIRCENNIVVVANRLERIGLIALIDVVEINWSLVLAFFR